MDALCIEPAATTPAGLSAAIVRWAKTMMNWDVRWQRGGIYPGEMAAFLGAVEVAGVRAIIESGRGTHAYSTHILGEYTERTRIPVVSIDVESDSAQGKTCRDSLRRYRALQCLVGDAFKLMPVALRGVSGPIALLVDGPKLQAANRLSLTASTLADVRVVAHHNCELFTAWGREFADWFPGAFHYEALGLTSMAIWQAFKEWEYDQVMGFEHYNEAQGRKGRSLQESSLALSLLPEGRWSFARLLRARRDPRYPHPMRLWLRWQVQRGMRCP